MTIFIVFCIGACLGSFINVCIFRLPRGESIISPRSHCQCGKPIPWYLNIPILSWFALRGKAACCSRKISPRYPMIEFLTALLITVCFIRMANKITFISDSIFICLLLIATFIDIDTMVIDDWITIGGSAIGITIAAAFPGWRHCQMVDLSNSFYGICFGSGLLLWIGIISEFFTKREAIGFGDIKLIGLIGSFIGPKGAVFAIFGGCLALSMIMFPVLLITHKTQKLSPKTEIPFAPFLTTGAIIYIFWDDRILRFFG